MNFHDLPWQFVFAINIVTYLVLNTEPTSFCTYRTDLCRKSLTINSKSRNNYKNRLAEPQILRTFAPDLAKPLLE